MVVTVLPFLSHSWCWTYAPFQGCRQPEFFCHQLYLFKLHSQGKQELPCFQCALSFYSEALAFRRGDSLAWPWLPFSAEPFLRLVPSCAPPGLCCPRSATFLLAAEWGLWWVREVCRWPVSSWVGVVPGAWRGLHSVFNQREVYLVLSLALSFQIFSSVFFLIAMEAHCYVFGQRRCLRG